MQQQKHVQNQQQLHQKQQLQQQHFMRSGNSTQPVEEDASDQMSTTSSISSMDSLETYPVRQPPSVVPTTMHHQHIETTNSTHTTPHTVYCAPHAAHSLSAHTISAQPKTVIRTNQCTHPQTQYTYIPQTNAVSNHHTQTTHTQQIQSVYTGQSHAFTPHTQQSFILTQQHRNATNVAVVPPTNISCDTKPLNSNSTQNASSTTYYNLKTTQSENNTEQLKIEDGTEDLRITDIPLSMSVVPTTSPVTIQRAVTVNNLNAGLAMNPWKHDVARSTTGK